MGRFRHEPPVAAGQPLHLIYPLDRVVAHYVAANAPISAAIQGPINCVGAACPVVTPWSDTPA